MISIISQAHAQEWLSQQSAPSIFIVGADTVLTKDAVALLKNHCVAIEYTQTSSNNAQKPKYSLEQPDIAQFQYLISNQISEQKNSYWTHLRGNQLIEKSHPIIRWRGALDSLLAHVMIASYDLKNPTLSPMLLEIGKLLRALLYADSTAQPLKEPKLWGYTLNEVQEISHHPLNFFGIDHFFVNHHMGRDMLVLNLLRAQTRELELIAIAAFPFGERLDLLQACNRLSSALYLLMFTLRVSENT